MEKAKKYWVIINKWIENFNQSPYAHYFGLAFIVACNLYYKFFFIGEMHVKHDDAFSIFHAQQNLSELYAQLSLEANPPLYFTLLHFWIKLFGIGPIAVKSLSAVFSVGAAIVIYFIGKKHMNSLGAFTAAFLFTFSNVHFDFSHEVRAFSLVFFLTALSIYLFLLVLENAKWKWLILLCLVNAALPYTHYTSVLVPVTEFLIAILVIIKDRVGFMKISGAFLMSAILFIPQLLNFKKTIPDESFWLEKPVSSDLEYVMTKLSGHDPSYDLIMKLMILSLILIIIQFFFSVFRKDFDYRKLILFIAIYFIPIYLNYWIAQFTPVFRMRYMLFAGIGPFLALAYMISKLKLPPLLLLAFAIYLMTPFKRSFTHKNLDIFRWDKVATVMQEKYQEGRDYYVIPEYRMKDFTYYYDRSAFSNYKVMYDSMDARGIHGINSANALLMESPPEIVLIQCNPQDVDPEQSIRLELAERNYEFHEQWFSSAEINVELWKKNSFPGE